MLIRIRETLLVVLLLVAAADVSAEMRKPRRTKGAVPGTVTVAPVRDTLTAVRAASADDAEPISVEQEYAPELLHNLTPAQMDSLVARWNTDLNERTFDRFYENFISFAGEEVSDDSLPDSVYVSRLRALASPVQLPYNPLVKKYILRYTNPRYGMLRRVMALSRYYFPMFEQELLREGLPVELRILPVIESGLSSRAVSRQGAAGLWQFMPVTGKNFGLEINSLVDERCDPLLSTRAACRYLRYLYNIYNDWTLALAAYNCGPGNVNKALARAGENCRTYWDIYYYLPSETRGYVPAFIGASYACAYHRAHGIEAGESPVPVATDTVTVHRIMHLEQVSSTLGMPLDMLRNLNPQYKLDIVPATSKEYSLVLPQQFVTQYIEREQEIMAKDSLYLKEYIDPANIDLKRAERPGFTHTVKSGETLSGIAHRYHITVREIMKWNDLRSDRLRVGQKLRIERAR